MSDLPKLVQLQERFADELVVVSLNVDFDSEGHPDDEMIKKISRTLRIGQVDCVNFIASTPMEEVMEHFDLFSLPAAILYDVDGNLVQKFDGAVDLEGKVTTEINARL